MLEVSVKIRFTTPCLGADRRTRLGLGVVFCFPRTPDGQVMFHQTWWRAIVTYAARVRNVPTAIVKRISWSPAIDGSPRLWQRYVLELDRPEHRRPGYAQHEAFLPGKVVGLECVLPVDLPPDGFRALLAVAGKYRGISPYKPGEYGRFEVVSIQPHGRSVTPESDMLEDSEPTGGPSGGLA